MGKGNNDEYFENYFSLWMLIDIVNLMIKYHIFS